MPLSCGYDKYWMRAKEFISESTSRGAPETHFSAVSPGIVAPSGRDNLYAGRYYDFYRIATLTGLDPEDLKNTEAISYLGNLPIFAGYTDADRDKLIRTLNKLGLNPSDYVPKGSREIDDINPISPVAKPKRNRYGV